METKEQDIRYIKSAVGELNAKGEFVGVASTQALDREGDIITQEGWVLDEFQSGGPLLWSHNVGIPAPGRILWAKVDGEGDDAKLVYKARLHRKNQFSRELYDLVKSGYITSVSVGFRAIDHEPLDIQDPLGGRRFTKQELMEISLVNVPALPQATITAVKGMGLKSDIIRKAFGLDEPESDISNLEEIVGKLSDDFPDADEEAVLDAAILLLPPECDIELDVEGKSDHPLDECVDRKIPIIMEENPEMEREQAVAIAFSQCREEEGRSSISDRLDAIQASLEALEEKIISQSESRGVVNPAADATLEADPKTRILGAVRAWRNAASKQEKATNE